MDFIIDTFKGVWESSGFISLTWQQLVMIALSCVLLYLGIVKQFEPLLLVGIAFGMLLTNLPITGLYHPEFWGGSTVDYGEVLSNGGLLDILYIGVKAGVYPSLIFLGVGAMTDFGPLIANPKSLLLGAAAQLGIYCAFILAILLGFNGSEAASNGYLPHKNACTASFRAYRDRGLFVYGAYSTYPAAYHAARND